MNLLETTVKEIQVRFDLSRNEALYIIKFTHSADDIWRYFVVKNVEEPPHNYFCTYNWIREHLSFIAPYGHPTVNFHNKENIEEIQYALCSLQYTEI